jgi:hypothetical protein
MHRASNRARSLARSFDAAIVATLLLWTVPGLFGRDHFGPIKLRDPGRLVFLATVLLAARLILAFPSWSRFADLGDFLRRMRIGARAGLFVAVAAAGVLVAFGTHTPFYRFGVESFGAVFRAIRVLRAGIVLFDLAIGVLAAWGLRASRGRRWVVAAALSSWPSNTGRFPWTSGRSNAKRVRFTGARRREPSGRRHRMAFATDAEVEYEFRSTAHWKPLVNGYSGFALRTTWNWP